MPCIYHRLQRRAWKVQHQRALQVTCFGNSVWISEARFPGALKDVRLRDIKNMLHEFHYILLPVESWPSPKDYLKMHACRQVLAACGGKNRHASLHTSIAGCGLPSQDPQPIKDLQSCIGIADVIRVSELRNWKSGPLTAIQPCRPRHGIRRRSTWTAYCVRRGAQSQKSVAMNASSICFASCGRCPDPGGDGLR